MLGLTRLYPSPKSKGLVVGTLITMTLLGLIALSDAYFFQRTKSFISPLQRNDTQNCAMTYSYPKYNRVEHVHSPLATKYKLYIYRDGYRDSDTLYGTPALFIPGQAGSYGQIRSLASTTTNLFHENQKMYNKNMDFFTVDLNEELSALNGQNLIDQAVYLNDVIKRIRELYQRTVPVMIIGHSMGGIVARAMFLQPNYIPNSIDTIVTISTPHLVAPLLLDPVIYKTYNDITEYWERHQHDVLKDVTMISIAGGSLDNIVHSDGVNMDSFVPEANGFTTYTTSIPNVWTGCDHMAILWCKQFIQILSSTLLQVINSENTVKERMRIFEYNLLEGTGIQDQNELTDLKKIAIRNFNSSVRLLFDEETTSSVTFVSAPKRLQLLTNMQPQFDMRWSIVLCKGTDIVKLECDYIKPNVTLLPSATAQNLIGSSPYRLLEITKTGYDYVGVIDHGGQKILGDEDQVFLIGHEVSSEPTLHPYSVWDFVLNNQIRIHIDAYHTLHTFPFIQNSLFAFDLKVVSINETDETLFNPMMQQAINGKELKYLRGLETGISDRISFHQQKSLEHNGLSLRFFMDSEAMDVSIKVDWYGTLGRCVLRYGSILILFFWAISLVVLLSQLYSYVVNGKREFIRFEVALCQCLKRPVLQLISLLLVGSTIQYYFPSSTKDMLFGTDDWMMVGLLLFAFFLSIGLTLVIWATVSLVVTILSVPLRLFPIQVQGSNTSMKVFVIHLTIVTALLGFMPSSLVFSVYFIVWLCMTSIAHVAAISDLPKIRNVYHYRLSWLVFFISLLPYRVPNLIAFVKDILIGWTEYKVSPIVLVQDIPALITIIYLVTIGRNPDRLEQKFLKPIIYIMNGFIIYQVLFGFLHPFPLHQLFISKNE